MQGEDRFYPLVPGINVQLGAVFSGDRAIAVREHISWPDRLRYDNGREYKLYIEPDASGCFPLYDLDVQLETIGVAEDRFEWTFMRERSGTKLIPAACLRKREFDYVRGMEVAPALWGFGRPHPFDPFFKPHQLLAGPVADHRPTAATTPPNWKFEPVWMCTILEGKPRFFELDPWWILVNKVFMRAEEYPQEVWEPELGFDLLLEFAQKNSSWRSARA